MTVERPPDPVLAAVPVGAVEVRGSDRLTFLHAVLSQHVVDLGPGRATSALFLDAQGRPLAMLRLAVLDDRVLLVAPDGDVGGSVAENLGSRTFLADASLTPIEAVRWSLRGERAPQVAEAAGLVVAPDGVRELDGAVILGHELGIDIIGPPSAVDPLLDNLRAAGAQDGDRDDVERWRVASGEPAWAHEVRAPHLPEEAGVLATHVHLDKGCYPGQEAVARMWMLGRPRRRLAQVTLVGDVHAGWTTGSGRDAAEVTSATDFRGEPVGLAFVPTGAEVGDRYGDDSAAIVVRGFVGEATAVPGHDPDVRRRRDQRAGA